MNIQKIDTDKLGDGLWLGDWYVEPNVEKAIYSVAYEKTKRVLLLCTGAGYGYYHTGSPNFWAKDEGVVFDSLDEAWREFCNWYRKIGMANSPANVNT